MNNNYSVCVRESYLMCHSSLCRKSSNDILAKEGLQQLSLAKIQLDRLYLTGSIEYTVVTYSLALFRNLIALHNRQVPSNYQISPVVFTDSLIQTSFNACLYFEKWIFTSQMLNKKKKKVLKYEQVEIKTWCLPQVALYNLTLPYCKYI